MLNLVTGGTGFVGAAVVRLSIPEGHAVRALARRGSDLRNLCDLDIELTYGDLADSYSPGRA